MDHRSVNAEHAQSGFLSTTNMANTSLPNLFYYILHYVSFLFDHISKLLSDMLVHGTTTYDLLTSTINSIPKDTLGDMSGSNNYRGIALISAVAKVCDFILIQRYQVNLKTSYLQFAYKSRHPTGMCHNVVNETINHYLNRGSEIYNCMLDASKAFDRLILDRLFSPIVIRALLDMYTRQKVRTAWNNHYSEYSLGWHHQSIVTYSLC